MLPPKISSPKSPAATTTTLFQRQIPVESPLSPYRHSSTLSSPVQAPVAGSPARHAADSLTPSNQVSAEIFMIAS